MYSWGKRLKSEEIKRFVESKFDKDYKQYEAMQGFPPNLMILHCEQVAKLALKIGRAEKASLDVLETAAWLHDVAAYEEISSGKRSEVLSAETAKQFLEEKGYPSDFIQSVVDAILSCGWDPVKKPSAVEQKVLADADFLHHIGPTGFVTTAVYYMAQGKNIGNIIQMMLQSIEFWKIHTETGMKIFDARKRFAQRFAQFLKEENDEIL